MATLKTIQASPLGIPQQNARIDASVFGDSSGASAIAHGLNDLSRGFQSASQDVQAVKMHLKQLDDMQYISKLNAEATKYSGEFLSDDNNAASPSFHQDYEKHMQKFAAVWTSSAPSKESKIQAQAHVDQIAAGGYNVALKTVVNKKISDTVTSIRAGLDGQGNTYSQMFAFDPAAAAEGVKSALTEFRSSIDKAIGKTNPLMAEREREQGVSGMIDRVMFQSPSLAREILSQSKDISNEKYAALITKIQHVEDTANYGAKKALIDTANRIEHAAKNGITSAQPLKEDQFIAAFGEKGKALYAEHKLTMDNVASAEDAFNSVMGRHPAEQQAAMTSFMEAHPTNVEAQTMLAHKLQQSATAFKKDPVAWMIEQNPGIQYSKTYLDELRNSGAPKEQILEATQRLNDDILTYQGAEA